MFILDADSFPTTGGKDFERPYGSWDLESLPKLLSAYEAQGLIEPNFDILGLEGLGLLKTARLGNVAFDGDGESLFRFTLQNGNRILSVECKNPETYTLHSAGRDDDIP